MAGRKSNSRKKDAIGFDGMTDAKINALPQDEFADRLFAAMEAKGPQLTCDDMDEIERLWETNMASRRTSLILLTKPFKWLSDKVQKDREFAVAVADIERITENLDFYRGMVELLEEANKRAMLALCSREDMHAIRNEVRVVEGGAA